METATKEIFKPVPNYETLYLISNFGRVKSLPRFKCSGKILTHSVSNTYHKVCLYKGNRRARKYFYVHTLVAQVFLPNPDHKPFINHKDCNKQNNNIDNLEWVTHQENMQHAGTNNRMKFAGLTKYNEERNIKATAKYKALLREYFIDTFLDHNSDRYVKYICKNCNKPTTSKTKAKKLTKGLCTSCNQIGVT